VIGSIIGAVFIGAIVGVLARVILPGRQHVSVLLTIVVGVIAALIGTFVARMFGVADTRGIDWMEHVIQLIVAILGIIAVTSLSRRTPP